MLAFTGQVLDGLRAPPVVLRPGGVTYEQLKALPGMHDLQVGTFRKHSKPFGRDGYMSALVGTAASVQLCCNCALQHAWAHHHHTITPFSNGVQCRCTASTLWMLPLRRHPLPLA
jgi:hypothetical protein